MIGSLCSSSQNSLNTWHTYESVFVVLLVLAITRVAIAMAPMKNEESTIFLVAYSCNNLLALCTWKSVSGNMMLESQLLT